MNINELRNRLRPKSSDGETFYDFGLGDKVGRKPGTRLINNDGTFNVVRRGKGRGDVYQLLIEMSWGRLMLTTLGSYVVLNILFAICFLLVGTDGLSNIDQTEAFWRRALGAFFFSVQTFTTVGYGGLAPIGIGTNILAALVALTGWCCLAIVTGVFYGRFARPANMVAFSQRALVTTYREGGRNLQFRIVNQRDSHLINLSAQAIVTWIENGNRRFAPLELERDFVPLFPLNWTIVHPITPESPIAEWTEQDYCDRRAEILITINGFDETFDQNIHVQNSYIHDEITWGGRFKPMYLERENTTELWLDRLDAIEEE